MSRRRSLATLAVLAIGVASIASCTKASEPAAPAAPPSYLYSQTAHGGSVAPQPDGTIALTFTGVAPTTVKFTDRPDRSGVPISTQQFIAGWGSAFAGSSPNAAIVLPDAEKSRDTLVATISDPKYDAASETLTYKARVILNDKPASMSAYAANADAALPSTFGAASIFIDGGSQSTGDSPPLKVIFANNTGRADSDVYVALTDGNPGTAAPVQVTETAGQGRQYVVPLKTLPQISDSTSPHYFELNYGASVGHSTGSLVWIAYGDPGQPLQLEVSPTAPSPDWASAVGKARFANVEQAYVAPTAVNQGDTTYVNQYSIPMDIESCDSGGKNCTGLYMNYYTDCILAALKQEFAKFGKGSYNDVVHYDADNNFVRVSSPDTNTSGWPVLADYVASLSGQTYRITNSFGTVSSTAATSTPFPKEEGYYEYTGTTRADGVTVLTGTIARQVNGPDPRQGRDGDTVTINPGDLASGIYSQAGTYSAVGPDASTPNNNDAYNSIYADFVTGLTSGYWGGKYGNDNSRFGAGGNAPFSAARNAGEKFLAYSTYSEVMWNYSNAYSMPYGERYQNGGHPSPLLTLQNGGEWKVTLHPDTTPGGCGGSWQPG